MARQNSTEAYYSTGYAPPPPAAPRKSRYTDMTADDFFDRRPTYEASFSPEMLKIEQDRINAVQSDDRGYNRFKGEALRRGPSVWSRLARANSFAEEANMRDQGAASVAGQTAQARNNLALRGGLTGGAAERVATGGARNYMDMSQNTARAGAGARMGIDLQDEQSRQQMLGQLPGMELAQTDAKMRKADSLNTLDMRMAQENERKNRFAMDAYNTEGSIYGAEKTAQAQEKANEGTWICTELKKHGRLTPEEDLRALRRTAWKLAPEMTRLYLTRGKGLVDRMEQARYDWKQLGAFHKELKQLLAEGKTTLAAGHFIKHIRALWMEFWPECEGAQELHVKGVC